MKGVVNVSMSLGRRILLDNIEFNRTSDDLRQIVVDMNNLRDDVNAMLTALASGFDTPAGRQFDAFSRRTLLASLTNQAILLGHIANNLDEAKGQYQAVFDAYDSLNESINT